MCANLPVPPLVPGVQELVPREPVALGGRRLVLGGVPCRGGRLARGGLPLPACQASRHRVARPVVDGLGLLPLQNVRIGLLLKERRRLVVRGRVALLEPLFDLAAKRLRVSLRTLSDRLDARSCSRSACSILTGCPSFA